MWIVVGLVGLISVSITAAVSTLFVIVMLNGFTLLPDEMVILYAGCAFGLGPLFGLLSGLASKKISEMSSIPAWLVGIGFISAFTALTPFVLVGFTLFLLVAFGKM